jgi:hypothetical protein
MPFLYFETHRFCTNIFFYNFRLNFIEICDIGSLWCKANHNHKGMCWWQQKGHWMWLPTIKGVEICVELTNNKLKRVGGLCGNNFLVRHHKFYNAPWSFAKWQNQKAWR